MFHIQFDDNYIEQTIYIQSTFIVHTLYGRISNEHTMYDQHFIVQLLDNFIGYSTI